eukprot:5525130-Pleurochrysis_carterae.AAC.1
MDTLTPMFKTTPTLTPTLTVSITTTPSLTLTLSAPLHTRTNTAVVGSLPPTDTAAIRLSTPAHRASSIFLPRS